ncbi:hypothetical protein [Amycolatopsis minnesotensis]|uniref:Uncharacterized protein n=1 Tax=Amycolatopsis minnesotensis TaxID=337894 RepID=A0ABP5BAX1_9PSEU
MNRDAIEEVLAELAAVTEEVLAQADAADARMNELSDAREALLEQRAADGVSLCKPAPHYALAGLRDTLAMHAAREQREAAREFAAWWADVATLAVLAEVSGQPVSPTRLAAADPTLWMSEEDMHDLPEIPESTRVLARLGAVMAAVPLGSGRADHDMAAQAEDHAARAGLRISYDDGQVVVKENGGPEARRCRLWGGLWTEARVPELPAPDELADLLTGHGTPESSTAAAVEAARAVDDAVIALLRARALDNGDPQDEPISAEDIDSLWNHADQLTNLLSHYARTITNMLPVLRTGDEPQ